MKKQMKPDKNLLHMDSRDMLVYSRGVSGKTNAEVGREMKLGEEHVALYQRVPNPGGHDYDLGLRRIAGWCEAVGNDIVPQWIAQRCGGVFVRTEQKGKEANIVVHMERVNKEAREAISSLLSSMTDGTISHDEIPVIAKELEDLCRTANEALSVAKNMEAGGAGK